MRKQKTNVTNTSGDTVSIELTQRELIDCAGFGDIVSLLSEKAGYDVKVESYTYQPQSGHTIYVVSKI